MKDETIKSKRIDAQWKYVIDKVLDYVQARHEAVEVSKFSSEEVRMSVDGHPVRIGRQLFGGTMVAAKVNDCMPRHYTIVNADETVANLCHDVRSSLFANEARRACEEKDAKERAAMIKSLGDLGVTADQDGVFRIGTSATLRIKSDGPSQIVAYFAVDECKNVATFAKMLLLFDKK